MHPTDNLNSLHTHEEELHAKSLAIIKADAKLSDHWTVVSEAMNVIYAFSHDHLHQSDNELTLQYLGIRLFNAAGASIRLALSGYYQKAFDQVRDILETYFLVDYQYASFVIGLLTCRRQECHRFGVHALAAARRFGWRGNGVPRRLKFVFAAQIWTVSQNPSGNLRRDRRNQIH